MTSALFLIRVVGLSPGQVAIGLSAAPLAGMVLTAPMGYVVDRRGPRGVQITPMPESALAVTAP